MQYLPNDTNMEARREMIKSAAQRRVNAAADVEGATKDQLRRFRRIEMFKLLAYVVGAIALIVVAFLIISLFLK